MSDIHKIEDIQKKMDSNDNDQINLLKKLIKKPEKSLNMDQIIIDEMYIAITRMKTTNSSGFNQIS